MSWHKKHTLEGRYKMKILSSKQEVKELIQDHQMSLIYFNGTSCGACYAIRQKLEYILEDYPLIQSGQINGEQHLALAAEYNVFSLPILILFVEGKETIREGRHLDILRLEEKIDRYYELIKKN